MEDAAGRVVLDLEPGLAFGTGTHENHPAVHGAAGKCMWNPATGCSTSAAGAGFCPSRRLLLGASEAVGVDIDELAVKTARENAALNHVESRFTALCGDLTAGVGGLPAWLWPTLWPTSFCA